MQESATGSPKRPGSIVVRFQSYVEKQRVLQAAWAKKDIRLNENRIYVDEDFPAQVYKERAKYRQIAAVELQKCGITMETSSQELDLEAILQAAGWESPRRKGKAGHADELTSSLKTLLGPPLAELNASTS